MRTLHWTIRCDSCDTTATIVADNYENPCTPTGWLRDDDQDTCYMCQRLDRIEKTIQIHRDTP